MLLMSPERILSARNFEELVNPDIIMESGFTPSEISRVIRKDNKVYNFRSAFISGISGPALGLHIVVAERLGKSRNWFFGTFEGPSWDRMGREEIEKYTQIETDILQGRNIVTGKELGTLILRAVKSFREREFPSELS